ncbi:MAG: nickel pincer cofactor biosynthesis protein LarC [Actinomycetia bacterium]|nr:nickel pincer cofactor biosynthesis protein LarC [Actinomycetes bacterium]MCH9801218.1 nickel pincer cofactor biosynthesis protein LarC [Actinomycetes bacterium]
MSVLHLDPTLGSAGDMLLSALVDLGADEQLIRRSVAAIAPEVSLSFHQVQRAGLRALQLNLQFPQAESARPWSVIHELLTAADLTEEIREKSLAVFGRLAAAEASVHGVAVDSVHFHEVGGTDALVDIVGCCAALASLAPETVTAGPVAVGSGYAHTAHGHIPVPAPAVLDLLTNSGARLIAGPATFESCTPTAAALLTTWVNDWVPGPALVVDRVGVGAGSRNPAEHPNIVRALLGTTARHTGTSPGAALLECNVDDMEPRLWPGALQSLLATGARDAWLTPIQMKKGRPAFTLHVLCSPDRATELAKEVVRQTTTIGLRISGTPTNDTAPPITKFAAERRMETVTVLEIPIRVKVAELEGEVVNVQPEWEDIAAVARNTKIPAKKVLQLAIAAARPLWT